MYSLQQVTEMTFIGSYFYDKIMAATESACLREWRKALLSNLSGEVLEIGAGTGANLEFYPQNNIRLTVSEPDNNMRQKLTTKMALFGLHSVVVTESSAEDLPYEDETFDFVVASLVCCSVKNLDATLAEINRVLKTAGGLVFLEHVAAKSGTSRRRWQRLLNPVWKKIAGNCHLNRETETAIESAGFKFQSIQKESMRKAMPLVRPTIRGVAIKQ